MSGEKNLINVFSVIYISLLKFIHVCLMGINLFIHIRGESLDLLKVNDNDEIRDRKIGKEYLLCLGSHWPSCRKGDTEQIFGFSTLLSFFSVLPWFPYRDLARGVRESAAAKRVEHLLLDLVRCVGVADEHMSPAGPLQ